jgi:transposase
MKFYNQQHKFYCGIDLHARKMYVCIIDQRGKTRVHQNIDTDPQAFFELIFPFIEDVVVAVECVFCWYWLADLCAEHKVPFVLGHALYMKAIHGGKTKNDKIDSYKIAALLKGGNLPMAYPYPARMRATRDLLRRRMHLVNKRAELLAHIQNTNTQYNLEEIGKNLGKKCHRRQIAQRFDDPATQMAVQTDVELIDYYDQLLPKIEAYIERCAQQHDPNALYRLRTMPGIGYILGLSILYEVGDIGRFKTVQDFSSYARLIRPSKESDGKWAGTSNKKIGNHHLKHAINEAAMLFLRRSDLGQTYRLRLEKKHGKGKSYGIFTHKVGRAVYYMLKNNKAFSAKKFFST